MTNKWKHKCLMKRYGIKIVAKDILQESKGHIWSDEKSWWLSKQIQNEKKGHRIKFLNYKIRDTLRIQDIKKWSQGGNWAEYKDMTTSI